MGRLIRRVMAWRVVVSVRVVMWVRKVAEVGGWGGGERGVVVVARGRWRCW